MMAHSNPAPSLPHPQYSSVNPKGKESTLEMVSQDEQIQSLHSQEGNVDFQNQKKADVVVEEEGEGEEMSLKGTLLSQDIRPDGWCPEGNEGRSMGDSHELEHPADEASHVSMSGSLQSGNFERDRGNIADCRHGSNRELQGVQGKMRDMHISDVQGKPAIESVIRKGDDGPADHRRGQCGSTVCGTKPAAAVPPNETTRAGDEGAERRAGRGGSKKEAEAALFPMQSSDGSQQTFCQEIPSKQSEDRLHSLHPSRSEPNMPTSQYSPPSTSAFSRSQSFQASRRREHFDMLLIYTKEDESFCADHFRSYAASKEWKVTSTAELPIGPLSLANFRKAMECCSYVVLLISPHFISDKACERHYNIAIQYGDKHPEFTDCVLPIKFDNAELPPELDAIQHARWGSQYFDNVMSKSVDVQKRLDRELQEAASLTSTSFPPSRAISVDATIHVSRTSFSQMASTPPTLSTVPALKPVHGSESYQTSAASQQPLVQRVPEQEACLMPSADQSPILPPIPVAKTPDVGATQSPHVGVAAAATGNQPHNATTTTSAQLRSAPEYDTKLPHQPVASAAFQQQAAYHQQPGWVTMQYQPSQDPEAVAGISLQSSGAMVAQPSSHISQAHQQHTHLPATCQPQVTYQQQVSVAARHYQPLQHAEASASFLQHSISLASPPSAYNIQPGIQRTISHPTQDYENMTGEEIFRSLSPEFKPGQAASQMLSANRFGQICELLDAEDIRGFDWRFLAEALDMSQAQIANLKKNDTGATRRVLEVFFLKNGTMGKIEVLEELMRILTMMKRQDAAEHVEKEILLTKCKRR